MVSRIHKFKVHMAIVVFKVGSLSKVMMNMNNMSFDSMLGRSLSGWVPDLFPSAGFPDLWGSIVVGCLI